MAQNRYMCGNKKAALWLGFSLCLCVSAVNISCSSKPTDMRSLVPADSLVYLETNDLAGALEPIVDNKAFEQVAKSKPDFSALKGVQLAIAVTGFETSEEKVNDDQSIGRIQPHFVAVADTRAWNFQAVGFTEKKLGSFFEKVYDSEPTLERSDKNGGKYFTWTAKDGRKAYALVIDSLIYFGNDETAIDKCLAVRRGEADNIAKTGKLAPADRATLASGYVSSDGIAQLANIIALKFASQASENPEVQRAIATGLPQFLQSSFTAISWTLSRRGRYDGPGILEDLKIEMPAENASVLAETLAPVSATQRTRWGGSMYELLPADCATATEYNLKDPQIAWRSVLSITQKAMDPLTARLLAGASNLLFEPYGIRDPDGFLGSVESDMWTVTFEDDKRAVIATVKDGESLKRSLVQDLRPDAQASEKTGLEIWKSNDGDFSACFVKRNVVVGDTDAVFRCIDPNKTTFAKGEIEAAGTADTYEKDCESPLLLATFLYENKSTDSKACVTSRTETHFIKTGIERRAVSDFGLIGSIIAQLAQD